MDILPTMRAGPDRGAKSTKLAHKHMPQIKTLHNLARTHSYNISETRTSETSPKPNSASQPKSRAGWQKHPCGGGCPHSRPKSKTKTAAQKMQKNWHVHLNTDSHGPPKKSLLEARKLPTTHAK